jgi:hypothetical protein
MANISHSEGPLKFTQIGIFCMKINHLAILPVNTVPRLPVNAMHDTRTCKKPRLAWTVNNLDLMHELLILVMYTRHVFQNA